MPKSDLLTELARKLRGACAACAVIASQAEAEAEDVGEELKR